jgi:probable HAF family extracellular repeat protein
MFSAKEISTSFMVLFAALLLFALAAPAHAQGFTFTTIDAPNSIFTVARVVNSLGDIVGWFMDTGGKRHAYLLSNGSFTQIDFNNDVTRQTTADGLNNGRDIVGDYRGTDAKTHGYLLSGGTFTTIDPPGSVRTTARAINSSGDIVGFFRDSTGFHGFLVNKNNLASFTTLDFPGATFTFATAINDSGQIVGLHGDSAFVDHAFVRSPADTFTAVADVPGAVDTDSWAIDNAGRIAGFYDDFGRALLSGLEPGGAPFPQPVAELHGFLRDGSALTRVNISGVSGGVNTCIFWVRDDGVIVGQYDSPDGRTHGFVGTPK